MVGARESRVLGPVLAIVTIVALVAGGLVIAFDRGWLDRTLCEGECPVDGPLDDIDIVAAEADGLPAVSRELSPEAVEDALDGLLGSEALGDVSLTVDDLVLGDRLVEYEVEPMIPASSQKVMTSYAALAVIGPEQRFSTQVRSDDDTLWLVGGGDPLLEDEHDPDDDRASLEALAERTATSLESSGIESVTLAYDDSLFVGDSWHPAWPERYRSGAGSRMTALRVMPTSGADPRNPAGEAAESFIEHLEDHDIEVRGEPERDEAPETAGVVAQVLGGTTGDAVIRSILASDNYVTEVLGHQIALAEGLEADHENAAQAISDVVTEATGSDDGLRVVDASGLARQNRVTSTTLVDLLQAAADDPDQAPLFDALPVAAYSGTLSGRFGEDDTEDAAGVVRAKTGRLSGVLSLTGVVTTADGGAASFSIISNDIPDGSEAAASEAIDEVLAALADCECT